MLSRAYQILIGGVVNGHVAAKYVYVRIFRHGDRMHKKDLVATGSWLLIGLVLWVAAWVIAEAIPVFNNLLSLIVGVDRCCFVMELTGITRRLCLPAGLPVFSLHSTFPGPSLTVGSWSERRLLVVSQQGLPLCDSDEDWTDDFQCDLDGHRSVYCKLPGSLIAH